MPIPVRIPMPDPPNRIAEAQRAAVQTVDAGWRPGDTVAVSYLLAHLSDAHIGPLPRPRTRELIGKRITGFMNWQRRGKLHDMAVLAALVADLKAQSPDHIAMTGDILNLGLPDEFPFARAWLHTLGTTEDVSFVPGNHDAYVRSSMPHLASTFAPWVAQERAAEEGAAQERVAQGEAEVGTADGMPFVFPYLRRRGPLALIGLSSAIPTAPLLASGALGRAQREGLARLLDEAGAQGLARVVMIHHPPHVDGAKRGRGLRDAAAFEALIARHGAELVIHGHNHRTSVAPLPGPRGPVPVVGVPSCSAVPGTHGHLAAYHLYRFAERAGGGFTVTAERRGLAPDRPGIGDLGPVAL